MNFLRRLIDSSRLAMLSAWRGRSRVAAIFAGVFLAALVMTTILVYSNGLMQVFFEESLENDIYEFRVEFHTYPGGEGRTNDSALLAQACVEYQKDSRIADCALAAGKQNSHGQSVFFNFDRLLVPLELREVNGTASDWVNASMDYHVADDEGPPTAGFRSIRFLGDGMFDGELRERHNASVVRGSWPESPAQATADRAVILPASLAREADVEIGDVIDRLQFAYIDEDDRICDGPDREDQNIFDFKFCRVFSEIYNLTVVGVYDEGGVAFPLVSDNAVYIAWSTVDADAQVGMMDGDHVYLAIAVDRSKLPIENIGDTQDVLTDIGTGIDRATVPGDLDLDSVNIIDASIFLLNIITIFIQVFDYIIIIPVIVLALAVLAFGLILSLEQRRKEMSIHRTIGGSGWSMTRVVLSEMLVVSGVAWAGGFLLAFLVAPLMLNAVGFMEFAGIELLSRPTIGPFQIIFTIVITLGLAMVLGFFRTRSFLRMEIAEGVKAETRSTRSWYWLYWLIFIPGLLSLIHSLMDDLSIFDGTRFSDGLVDNFFLSALLNIFGPFFLWIGGALVLARVGAASPRMFAKVFGKTPLLRDVRRGLRPAKSTEGVGRLAVILVLTLSIITMAAVQGYTGTELDERSASVTVGADLRLGFSVPVNKTTATAALAEAWTGAGESGSPPSEAVAIPSIVAFPVGDPLTIIMAYVIMDLGEDVIHWDKESFESDSPTTALANLRDGGFYTTGEVVRSLDLGEDSTLDLATVGPAGNTSIVLDYSGEFDFIPGADFIQGSAIIMGESSWRTLTGAVGSPLATTWYFEIPGVAGEDLVDLGREAGFVGGVAEIAEWETAHRLVERNGGLIFGTQGLLSLQFVVASAAAIASSFVFLSLVLNQRRKELAILQAIGGSHAQVARMVLFEVLAIVIGSMIMGIALGVGISYSFNGMFNLFGFLFQFMGGSSVGLTRELIWPVWQLAVICAGVLLAVIVALGWTVRQALKADLAQILKGE